MRIAFDYFEVDLKSGEVFKRGERVRLQPQPFKIFEMLLARPGELISREEICRAVWDSDTFVEFEHGVGTAIRKIREALDDCPEDPRTIPKRGYRFIGQLSNPNGAEIATEGESATLTPSAEDESTGSEVAAEPRLSKRFRFVLAAGATAHRRCAWNFHRSAIFTSRETNCLQCPNGRAFHHHARPADGASIFPRPARETPATHPARRCARCKDRLMLTTAGEK
jgi:DNA-binding winged helix-turn-helix (wHTH) protein